MGFRIPRKAPKYIISLEALAPIFAASMGVNNSLYAGLCCPARLLLLLFSQVVVILLSKLAGMLIRGRGAVVPAMHEDRLHDRCKVAPSAIRLLHQRHQEGHWWLKAEETLGVLGRHDRVGGGVG